MLICFEPPKLDFFFIKVENFLGVHKYNENFIEFLEMLTYNS